MTGTNRKQDAVKTGPLFKNIFHIIRIICHLIFFLGFLTNFFVSSFTQTVSHTHLIKLSMSNDSKSDKRNMKFENKNFTRKNEEVIGIGGLDGFVYDVNKVKRNLVQETQYAYKRELIELFEKPNRYLRVMSASENQKIDDLIQEKIAVLIMSNPVSTTTDSNLLDGLWEFIYVANDAKKFLRKQQIFPQQSSGIFVNKSPWRLLSGKRNGIFRSVTRDVYLEDLKDDEDPYIVDSTSIFGGIVKYRTSYKVTKLMRQSLHLQNFNFEIKFPIFKSLSFLTTRKQRQYTLKNKILYLDSDLCMFTLHDFNSPLYIYTKSEAWKDKGIQRSKGRFLKIVPSLLSSFRFRKRLGNLLHRAFKNTPLLRNNETNLKRKIFSKGRVLPIGEVITNLDQEEKTWSTDEDPFIHLDSNNQRLQVINKMSIEELEAAGELQKIKSKKLSQQKQKTMKSKKKFKPPPSSS